MGSKRSGGLRTGRQAVTRREQKRAKMASQNTTPRTTHPTKTAATPNISTAPESNLDTSMLEQVIVEQVAASPSLTTSGPAFAPGPPPEQAEPAPEREESTSPQIAASIPESDIEPIIEERSDLSDPDTLSLPATQVGGRRRYPTLARMASISPRNAPPTHEAHVGEAPAAATSDMSMDEKAVTSLRWYRRTRTPTSYPRLHRAAVGRRLSLPPSFIVVVVAGIHAALTVMTALASAALLLTGNPLWIWLLALSGILGAGAWIAHADTQSSTRRSLAATALACSHIGVLVWALAFLGPRPSMLLLVPGAGFLALRVGGRGLATFFAAACFTAYMASAVLAPVLGLAPVISLGTPIDAVFDDTLIAVGLTLALAGAFDATAGRAQAELLAQMRRRETQRLQTRVDRLRRQAEDDAATLYSAVDAAREGRPLEVAGVDGVFSPVIGGIAAIGQYVLELQEEMRLSNKVEAAIGQLILALERSWLGLAWSWPAPTGTPVDDVVSLLRTPNPRHLAPLLADDEPTGPIPVPTDPEMPARRRVIPVPRTDPRLDGLSLYDMEMWLGAAPAPTRRVAPQTSPLRWQEWDDWRGWQGDPTE